MLLRTVTCPTCRADLEPPKPLAASVKVRCPDCGAVFNAGDGGDRPARRREAAAGPARKREKQKGRTGLVVGLAAAGVGLVLLLAGGVLVVAWASGAFSTGGTGAPPGAPGASGAPDAPGTPGSPAPDALRADFDKIDLGVTLAEAEAVLGPGKKIAFSELPAEGGMSVTAKAHDYMGEIEANEWRQWGDAPGLVVGLSKAPSGAERVTFVGYRAPQRQRYEGELVGVYDQARAGKLPAEADCRARPKTRPGKLRDLILGRWRAHGGPEFNGAPDYDFRADGVEDEYIRDGATTFKRWSGQYRVIDDDTLEITYPELLKTAPVQAVNRYTVIFYNADELRMITSPDTAPNYEPLYKRAK
jgi:hypothetical protein